MARMQEPPEESPEESPEAQRDTRHDWALVLAAGEGSRLQSLTTTPSGIAIPKQFCSMGAGSSLLHSALKRAAAVVPAARTCAVVAEQHRRWWQALSLGIPAQNVICQPRNRGTALGILLPLLSVVHRDPQANILILPSDHYVRNEDVLVASMKRAMEELQRDGSHLILLGVTPDEADPELGYIVADSTASSDIRTVSEFVEKPDASTARALIARGGVWNSFIFAARAQTLMRAFEERCGDLVSEMQHVVTSPGTDAVHLAQLYERLPNLDFSRDVLQRFPSALKLLTVPACGWSDLGTPRRVIEAARRYNCANARPPQATGVLAFLDLVARQAQLNPHG